MTTADIEKPDDFDLSFKVFHDLMARKVSDILLVSSPYDAFIMEEDGRLAERIIHEYRGLNLSRPPRLTWESTARDALAAIRAKAFDLVITMPRLGDMDTAELCRNIKAENPQLPVFLLSHDAAEIIANPIWENRRIIDRRFVWSGNTDLLIALIKNHEDKLNVTADTLRAGVRVLILVEDSPFQYSSLLPLLYREIVLQTQAVMEESVNDEDRILRMRARPKILLAEDYETALDLCHRFQPYLLGLLSDVTFPKNGKPDKQAGVDLLKTIKALMPDLPLLNLSSEETNRKATEQIPAVFLNKNDPALHGGIRLFFKDHLGFGDFVFRLPDGKEVARAANLREMEKLLPSIPEESVRFHAMRNHFSSWLMARSEIMLATRVKPLTIQDFDSVADIKRHLRESIRRQRKKRQWGAIAEYVPGFFDPDADFIKEGRGSLGGKARGLAFMATQLKENSGLGKSFPEFTIRVPRSLVISTEAFDNFIEGNGLKEMIREDLTDSEIRSLFMQASLPAAVTDLLEACLPHFDAPLAVRSSSLLEDAQFQPFAGIYSTCMIPNAHPDKEERLRQLSLAVKRVYASTFLSPARSYAKSTVHRIEEEKMAVIVQELTGRRYKDVFFPAISGVAQSYNFYPVEKMQPEEGTVTIAFGMGKTVVEGGTALRFSPAYPQVLPHFSTVEDILKNAQRFFYALNMEPCTLDPEAPDDATLMRLDVDDYATMAPARFFYGFYSPDDNRIREGATAKGYPVLTFANILKYEAVPLPALLRKILDLGGEGMGCPVEIEFALNLNENGKTADFSILQIRPMAIRNRHMDIHIETTDPKRALCYSEMALGNGETTDIADILYVKPDAFDIAKTESIAREIGAFNAALTEKKRKYLLIGPGRWGSADRWLGIPVGWKDISGVGAIVETQTATLKADPSQGSHFFHNITSLGIGYITVPEDGVSMIGWQWLAEQAAEKEGEYVRHVRTKRPLVVKIDGKRSRAVVLIKPA